MNQQVCIYTCAHTHVYMHAHTYTHMCMHILVSVAYNFIEWRIITLHFSQHENTMLVGATWEALCPIVLSLSAEGIPDKPLSYGRS